ncbi:hypothetical protein M405DRAFT_881752 [Rhizopogon salebrosus TDB-379]|nr:hypothetical protein M405DRAFT_881752 [Rhizopogon salebrosus TDB-379]
MSIPHSSTMTPSETATSTVTTMTKGKLCMDIIVLIIILIFGFLPSLVWAIGTDNVIIIGSVGGMGASWAFAAMAVKLFGKDSEEGIAILCFLFTLLYMVVIWAAEIESYFYFAGLPIPSLFTWTASFGKMDGMELANRYTPLAFISRLSTSSA